MTPQDPIAELMRLVDALVDSQRNVFCAGNGKTEAEIFGRQAIREHARKMVDEVERLRKDASTPETLAGDHADIEMRKKCRSILDRMSVMSYSAVCTFIDAAIQESQP